jgi:spore maturation protein CgeB
VQNKNNYNMRTFEIPSSKGFMLAQRSDESREYFSEDKEAVYFSSPEELKDKAAYYLAHDDARLKIAAAGYNRCITSDYSYLSRVRRLLEVSEENSHA